MGGKPFFHLPPRVPKYGGQKKFAPQGPEIWGANFCEKIGKILENHPATGDFLKHSDPKLMSINTFSHKEFGFEMFEISKFSASGGLICPP